MRKRWLWLVVSAAVALTILVAVYLGAQKSPTVLSTCGGTRLPDGTCVGIPIPGAPGTTCVPQTDGPCSWVWKSPYAPQ